VGPGRPQEDDHHHDHADRTRLAFTGAILPDAAAAVKPV